jgi:arylsulfatase B
VGWALRSGPHSRSSRSEAERTRSIAAPGSCLVAFLALALGLASTARANDFERADSLVLIVADDLGIDRVGCYADTAARTPNIDQLATEGTRFETCWAAPRCTPARAMILTGLFPYRTGVGGKMKPSDTFDLSLPSLADLSTSGRARLIGKWHLTQDVNAPGLLGFEHRGSMKNLATNETYFRWWKNVEGTLEPSFLYATTDNVDEAIRSLDHDVVILMFNAPHKPHHVPPPHLHSFGMPGSPTRQYRAMVEAMDSEIGRLLAAIDSDPTRNPLVIFTSDNGTPGHVVEEGEDPLKMKGSHYEGGLRVPLIVRGPGVAAGVVDKRLTSVVDFYATAKELLGVPGSVPVDSVSIFSDEPRRWIFAETFHPNGFGPYDWRSRSIRNDRFKLNCRRYPLIQERALYDLWTDPRENHNLLEGPLTAEEQAAYEKLLALLP